MLSVCVAGSVNIEVVFSGITRSFAAVENYGCAALTYVVAETRSLFTPPTDRLGTAVARSARPHKTWRGPANHDTGNG